MSRSVCLSLLVVNDDDVIVVRSLLHFAVSILAAALGLRVGGGSGQKKHSEFVCGLRLRLAVTTP